MESLKECILATASAIREQRPLVHNITNYVVMNTTANALLAVGASPVMAHAAEEVAEFAAMSGSVVINIGTLSAPWVESMHLAASAAAKAGVPWVLDPVGSGATAYRTHTTKALLRHSPAVIRSNASELLSLEGRAGGRGVDSLHGSEAAVEAGRAVARELGTVVAVTGAIDYVISPTRTAALHNGHPMMGRVTGMGCMATAVVGAALAVQKDPFIAALAGLALMGVAGEWAAHRANGPGTFQLHFLDALYVIDRDELEHELRLE